MCTPIVDMEKIARDHARAMLPAEVKKYADKVPFYDWTTMDVYYGPTQYKRKDVVPQPKVHVLYCANLSNNTGSEQCYSLTNERYTLSRCKITYQRNFKYGGKCGVSAELPGVKTGMKADFTGEVTKSKGSDVEKEQKLIWSVNSRLRVKPNQTAKVEMVVKEQEFNEDFEQLCTFDGFVTLMYVTKKDREPIVFLELTAADILTSCHGFHPDHDGKPTFVMKGTCSCRMAVEQSIYVSESSSV
ncbi:uncharacterized protein LOC131927973 [Physella acuta]|uniref:uncharacterized protein LOC131927973 n=1 Tax=Physella acuta TaxID=109671 RepID=UPI0027DCE772|nr:uncharacterized protein LOC131927973 [Physella acuta]XP_059139834.1 uncharacterized protein LOC131927973 [Physella acuta]